MRAAARRRDTSDVRRKAPKIKDSCGMVAKSIEFIELLWNSDVERVELCSLFAENSSDSNYTYLRRLNVNVNNPCLTFCDSSKLRCLEQLIWNSYSNVLYY